VESRFAAVESEENTRSSSTSLLCGRDDRALVMQASRELAAMANPPFEKHEGWSSLTSLNAGMKLEVFLYRTCKVSPLRLPR
jgi:hypothetical protein